MKPRGFLLFDIDGVIRDVANSYRRAIQETVNQFCNCSPSVEEIDNLKAEGIWNNDWDASLELIRRNIKTLRLSIPLPNRKELIKVFDHYYFGGNPNGCSQEWSGFINNEPLIVNEEFFQLLKEKGFLWGFVSGAEPSSAKFVLETRLQLKNAPLIAMGDAPDKPDPSGLLKLARQLSRSSLGSGIPPVVYLGDTVADVLTIKRAREECPTQKFFSYAVSPPHLHEKSRKKERLIYESKLKNAGADKILSSTCEVINEVLSW